LCKAPNGLLRQRGHQTPDEVWGEGAQPAVLVVVVEGIDDSVESVGIGEAVAFAHLVPHQLAQPGTGVGLDGWRPGPGLA
jgi:hypothetical protein